MGDHPKHVRGMREAYTQCNTPLQENDRVGGTNSGQGKFDAGNPDDDDNDTQINSDLLNTWMQRTQVLTVVTTFLASMDGEMFSLTTLNTEIGLPVSTTYRQLVYSCLAGALIFHICASILGYIASFALMHHRIIEDTTKVGVTQSSGLVAAQPAQRPPRRIILEPVLPPRSLVTFLQRPEGLRFLRPSAFRSSRSSLPPPFSLLAHCYYTTLCLAAVGFILALTGILTYMWAGLPAPVGIFSTICLGVAVSAGVWAIAL